MQPSEQWQEEKQGPLSQPSTFAARRYHPAALGNGLGPPFPGDFSPASSSASPQVNYSFPLTAPGFNFISFTPSDSASLNVLGGPQISPPATETTMNVDVRLTPTDRRLACWRAAPPTRRPSSLYHLTKPLCQKRSRHDPPSPRCSTNGHDHGRIVGTTRDGSTSCLVVEGTLRLPGILICTWPTDAITTAHPTTAAHFKIRPVTIIRTWELRLESPIYLNAEFTNQAKYDKKKMVFEPLGVFAYRGANSRGETEGSRRYRR